MPLTHESRSQDPLKEAAIIALTRIADPLIDLMFDAGITVQEFNRLLRERSVRVAAARITKDGGRSSNSRVAIMTGLPRTEVARILSAGDASSGRHAGQHPARKVLAAWYSTAAFLRSNGDPDVLPIFGRRRSFEQLVATHSGGIPVRAMLDQLAQIDAVEILPGQRVRAKSRLPIFTGLTRNAVAIIGERAGDLLETLKGNLRATAKPLFEGTAVVVDVDVDSVPLLRRELEQQGAAFIDTANSLLARSRTKSRRSASKEPQKCRVGVTVYYFQDETLSESGFGAPLGGGRRKNLRRHRSKSRRS
jgi:hypothetical protein